MNRDINFFIKLGISTVCEDCLLFNISYKLLIFQDGWFYTLELL